MPLTPLTPALTRALMQHMLDLRYEAGEVSDAELLYQSKLIASLPDLGIDVQLYTWTQQWPEFEADAWARLQGGPDYKVGESTQTNGTGSGGGGGGEGPDGGAFVSIAVRAIIFALSQWPRYGPVLFARTTGGVRMVYGAWNKVPLEVRAALTAVGLHEAYDEVIQGDEQDVAELVGGDGRALAKIMNLPAVEGLPSGVGQVTVVKTWVAGGVPFWRLSNGVIVVQKLDGTVRWYRPKRPAVLYAGSGNTRRSIRKAVAILKQEYKDWKDLEKLFGPKQRGGSSRKTPQVINVETGSGSITGKYRD